MINNLKLGVIINLKLEVKRNDYEINYRREIIFWERDDIKSYFTSDYRRKIIFEKKDG